MSAIHLAVAVFLNSLWEDALLVLAVWALLKNIRVNASTRYFSWLVTLVAAILLPILTTLPQMTVPHAVRAHQIAASGERVTRTPAIQRAPANLKAPANVHVLATQPVPAAASSTRAAGGLHFPSRLQLVMPAWLAKALFFVWAALALLIAGRLAFDLYRLERLKREALPLPFELRDQMARWVEAAYGPSREVRICVSNQIEVPVAVGLFDSMILLPAHLLEQLSAHEIDRISLHELAHLRRADDWTNSLQRLAQILFFFNPAIRFIGAQLDLEREVACDDWVLALTGEIRPYATCLTKMAELTAWPHRALAAPGVFATRKGISVRIERLLNKHRNARVNVAYFVPAGVVVALATLFVLANVVTPVIAYTPEGAIVTLPPPASHKPPAPRRVSAVRPILTAQVSPAPQASPATGAPVRTIVRTIVHNHTVFVHKTVYRPLSMPRHPGHAVSASVSPVDVNVPPVRVSVPAVHVNVPATHVYVPAIHVYVPGIHVHVRPMHIGAPTVARQVAQNGGSCGGCDLSDVNWSGRDLSRRSFSGSDFSNANLAGTNFSYSQLSGVDFSGANLRNANFSYASLSGCNLSGADISGARFDHASISGCEGVNPRSLDRAQLRTWVAQCSGCNFSGADFRGMDLRGVHVSGVDFSRADFRGADLSDASFSGVDFSRVLLSGARVRGTRFTGCDFSRTDLRNVDLGAASITASDLSSAIMR